MSIISPPIPPLGGFTPVNGRISPGGFTPADLRALRRQVIMAKPEMLFDRRIVTTPSRAQVYSEGFSKANPFPTIYANTSGTNNPLNFPTKEAYVASKDIFNREHTGMPAYDSLFGKEGDEILEGYGIPLRQYHKEYKKMTGDIVYMTPDQYIETAARGQWEASSKNKTFEEFLEYTKTGRVSEQSLSKLRKAIQEGKKINLPSLEYDASGLSDQEGYHRAIIAKELGQREIPVLLVKKGKVSSPVDNLIGKKSKLESDWLRAHDAAKKNSNYVYFSEGLKKAGLRFDPKRGFINEDGDVSLILKNYDRTGNGRSVVIDQISTSPESRGEGKASDVMRRLIEVADREGVDLKLIPDRTSPSEMSTKDLKNWYGRLGFVEGKNNLWTRKSKLASELQKAHDAAKGKK